MAAGISGTTEEKEQLRHQPQPATPAKTSQKPSVQGSPVALYWFVYFGIIKDAVNSFLMP